MPVLMMGLLAGWKRRDTSHGLVLTLEVIDAAEATNPTDFAKVVVALGDEQLCALTRDLARAAKTRNLPIWKSRRSSIARGVDRLLDRILKPRRQLQLTDDRASRERERRQHALRPAAASYPPRGAWPKN